MNLESLRKKHADLVQQFGQTQAALNNIAGAIQLLNELISEVEQSVSSQTEEK